MTAHTESFISSLAPEEVVDRFKQFSTEKGWKIKSEDQSSVEVKQGVTFRTWGEHIELSTNATSEGTNVHLTIASPQLVDWGQGSEIEREVKSRLGG